MTNAVIPADFESAWLAERRDLLSRAANIATVSDDCSLEVAGEVQTAISKAVKKLEAERKSITAPLDDAKKQIMAQEKKLAAPLNTELSRLKAMTSAYATECARRIEEERRRQEAEERRAAEAAVAAEDNPFAPTQSGLQAAFVQPIPQASMPRTSSNRMVERWDFAIIDANAVPREFCSPDEKKIRAFLSAKKADGYKADQIVVNGIKISATVQVQSR
jgi:hypothetical protein